MQVWRTRQVRPDMGTLDLKIKRANQHIGDLNAAISAFHKTNPKFVDRKVNPDTGEHIFYVTAVPEVPGMISVIAGDILQNLRSALDHLVYHLVARAIAPKAPPDYVSLPIADSRQKYMSPKFRRKLELAGPEAIKRLDALKPYKGGNDLLWQLGKLNNVDKHQ